MNLNIFLVLLLISKSKETPTYRFESTTIDLSIFANHTIKDRKVLVLLGLFVGINELYQRESLC